MSVFERLTNDEMQEVLRATCQISRLFIQIPDDKVFEPVLNVVLSIVKSRYGIMSYINDKGDCVSASMTPDIWKKCEVEGKRIIFPKDQWKGVWGHALKTKKTVYDNSGNFNIPDGHVKITRALTAPILYNDEAIGNFVLANKETDYTQKDIDLLKTICISISPILKARLERDFMKRTASEAKKAIWDMLNYANMYLVVLDEKMHVKIMNWSLATKLGFKNEFEPLGRCWLDFINPKEHMWIRAVHDNLLRHTEDSKKYREVTNTIYTLDKKPIMVKWFNAIINSGMNFTFSFGLNRDAPNQVTEESVRAYYRDVLDSDRTMISALKEIFMEDKEVKKVCEPEL